MCHDETINTIQGGGGDLCELLSLGEVFCDEGLKQLRLQEDGFCCSVSGLDAPLLGEHELLGGELPLYFVSNEDTAISLSKNVLELLNALKGVDLADYFDVFPLWTRAK